MVILILIITFFVAFFSGYVVIPFVSKLARRRNLYDSPDRRKVHTIPIPRLGGVVFIPAVIITVSLVMTILLRFEIVPSEVLSLDSASHFLTYLAGAVLLYIVGIYDDLVGVSYRVKFIVQIASASAMCLGGLWIATFSNVFSIGAIPCWIGIPLTILFVVYVTNAMNLIDGIDGLASGLSLISLLVIAFFCLMVHQFLVSIFVVSWIGVVLSFFYYNMFNKRFKIFMGDAGSLTLGYSLAFLIVHFWQREPVAYNGFEESNIIVISTLIIPLFDVVRVFLSRIRDGRRPFLPDKNHIHHKLLRAGLSPFATMFVLILVSVLFIASNYYIAIYLNETLMVIADVVLFVVFQYALNFFISRKEKVTWNREFTIDS